MKLFCFEVLFLLFFNFIGLKFYFLVFLEEDEMNDKKEVEIIDIIEEGISYSFFELENN